MSTTRTLALSLLFVFLCASAQAQQHKPVAKPKASTRAGASGSFELGGRSDTVKGADSEPAASVPASSIKEEPPAAQPVAQPAAQPAPAAVAAELQPAPGEAESNSELASVQQDLAQVMDELVQARARVAVLGKALFKTRVRLKIDNRAAPDQVAVRATLWLDGAPIFNGDSAAIKSPDRVLFDGFAAPGPHMLTVEVEQRARKDEAYRYTLRNSYRFMVVREKRTDLVLVLDDDSDMAEDFADDQEGEYDVRTRLKVRAVGLNEE